MRKITKLTMITVSLICLLSLLALPAYAFDKAEMDQALREELAKIPDMETKQAILDEYKEVIRERMPDLNLDEATCQSCEEDIKVLENELVINSVNGVLDEDKIRKDREVLPETNTPTPAPTVVTPVVEVPPPPPPVAPKPPKPPCGC
ncbi:MAG: hypothetical protein Q8L26_08820 [Candidatus Omnitrophota bacterium]|nr:hypothetical protein [Candidatus Omnitrophota bacterium]